MADDEQTLFETEQQMTVHDAAQRLRAVADGLEAGALQLGGHTATPAGTVKYEEEYSAETSEQGITFELELELKWSATADGRPGRGAAGVAGRFELFRDVGGKFRFRLKAGNGQVIASSEAYETKAAARNGITSVQTNARTGRIDDQT